MGTIQARIEGRVGEDASGSDIVYTTTHMQDAYDHGLRAVIMAMPEKAWKFFGKNRVDFLPLVGTPLLTDKIISVLRRDGTYYRPCKEIDADMAGPAADANSIHKASAFTPVYFVESGSFSNPMLKVLPEDGSKAARLVSLAIPTVDVTTDTIVPHFPDELEELPEIYTAAWIKQREMGVLRRSSQDELEAITSSGYLASFEGSLPVFVLPGEPDLPDLTLVPMTALPTLTLSSATDTWPTLSLTPKIVLPSLTIPSMDDMPAYVSPTIGKDLGEISILRKPLAADITLPDDIILPSLALTSAPAFTDLDLSGVSIPTAVLSYTSAGAEPDDTITVTTPLPAYDGPTAFTYDTTHTADALTRAQEMADDAGINSVHDTDSLLDDDLLDHTRVGLQAIGVELSRAQTSIQDERAQLQDVAEKIREALGKFNGAIAAHQSELAKEAAAAQADVQAYTAKMQDNRNDLEKEIAQYRSDVDKYQARVNAVVTEWVSEEVQFKLQKWQSQVQSEIGEYREKVSGVINLYQVEATAKIGKYRADFERGIREAEVEMRTGVSEWSEQKKADLQKLATDVQEALGKYQNRVNAVIAEFRELVNSVIGEYQAKATAQIQQYSAITGAEVAEHRSNVEAYLGELRTENDSEIREFQQKSGAYISEHQAKNTVLISEKQTESRALIDKYAALLNAKAQEFTGNLAKARSYLEEGQIRLATMQNFDQKSVSALNEARLLQAEFDKKLGEYKAQFQKEPKVVFADRRRS